MAVSIAPSVEAMQAIVARINSGTAYCLDVKAAYTELQIDTLEEVRELRVDVVTEGEEQPIETLEVEDYTSHQIRIWIRKKLRSLSNDEIGALKLLVRQIFQRVNNYDTTDRRVCVWECDVSQQENPDKDLLNQAGLFVSSIVLRVEVAPSP
jgi:hypothetical protein